MNLTAEDIKKIKDQMRKDNLLDKNKLSKQIRRKTSARDDRFSAKALSYFGVTCLTTVGMIIILMDFAFLANTLSVVAHNIGGLLQRVF